MFRCTTITRCSIVFVLISITIILSSTIQAYNLNVDRANVFSHPHKYQRQSYFGFTVALYNGPQFKDQSVLVGAPRANTTQILVDEPGAVYKCTLNGNCTEWSMDNTVGEIYKSGTVFRHNSWLGASISVENTNNPKIVVCAPRWKIKWEPEWYMTGICYYTKIDDHQSFDETPITRMMPLTKLELLTATDSNNVGYHVYGMASLGFSLNTFSHKEQWGVVLGSPGAHTSLGDSILVCQNNSKLDYSIPGVYDITYQYLGYSATSGRYFSIDQIQYAIGAPRSTDMNGGVRVYFHDSVSKRRHEIDTLNGTQTGEYFGAALTSCDFDNDGKDEIIVGAPMWTKKGDEGSIYIFTAKNTEKFKLSLQINGNVKDARFGTSVTCLGDIDRNGYQDIAVSAPYENGHGAIYIFNGNPDGLSTTWSQRIAGNEFPHDLRGFGISISQPRDVDGNGYLDVAIGAHLSGHAVVIRSQSVVSVAIQISPRRMRLSKGATSFPIRVCGAYTGVRPPKLLNTTIRLKLDPVHGRAYMKDLKRENGTYCLLTIMSLLESTCRNLTVLLKERNLNVIDPIEISASLLLDPELNSASNLTDFFFNSPVINKNMSNNEDNITVEFEVDCGIDNVCDSNITLDMMTNLENENHFATGSKEVITLFIDIHNYGEAAYRTLAHVFIPESMALVGIPENCESKQNSKIPEIICNDKNPLIDQSNFTLELVMRQMRSNENYVRILAYVTTQSNNLNPTQSKKNLTIYFDNDVDITVSGHAHETSYFTFDNERKHKLQSIEFQHIYEVRKFGVTPIMQSRITVSIPTHMIDRESKDEIEIAEIKRTDVSLREVIIGQNSPGCTQEQSNNIHNESKHSEIYNRPDNHTLYISCTDPMVICAKISCLFETSSSSSTIGDVTITMELKLENFTDNVINGTSTIYFMSNGCVNIISPTDIIQKPGNKPDDIQVGTAFDSSRAIVSRPFPIWIIVLSAFLGILILALLTFGLIKFGFFKRKKNEELHILKSDEAKRHTIILGTTSSREMLDQE